MPERTEVRLELEPDDLRVLDGYVHATGTSRTDVIRSLIREWADRKLHEAILICRVAGVNPVAPEINRNHNGGRVQ